jgi:hypothetical protein
MRTHRRASSPLQGAEYRRRAASEDAAPRPGTPGRHRVVSRAKLALEIIILFSATGAVLISFVRTPLLLETQNAAAFYKERRGFGAEKAALPRTALSAV